MTSIERMEAVVKALEARKVQVTLEYPGFIGVQTEKAFCAFGDGNGYWSGDFFPPTEVGERTGGTNDTLPLTSTVDQVADWIIASLPK